MHQFISLLYCCHYHCNFSDSNSLIKYLTRSWYKSQPMACVYWWGLLRLLLFCLPLPLSDLFNRVASFHFQNFGLEYERYLKEIVSALETDETFRKKLEESNISDIKVTRAECTCKPPACQSFCVYQRWQLFFLLKDVDPIIRCMLAAFCIFSFCCLCFACFICFLHFPLTVPEVSWYLKAQA